MIDDFIVTVVYFIALNGLGFAFLVYIKEIFL